MAENYIVRKHFETETCLFIEQHHKYLAKFGSNTPAMLAVYNLSPD